MFKDNYHKLLIVLSCQFVFTSELAYGQVVSADEIEEQSLASRRAIQSCYMEIRSEMETKFNEKSPVTRFEFIRRIWWSPNRMRMDVSETTVGKPPKHGRITICRNHDGNGRYLRFDEGNRVDQVEYFTTPEPGRLSAEQLFDPRCLGYSLTVMSNLNQESRIDSYIGKKSDNPAEASNIIIDGVKTYSYKRMPRSMVEYEVLIRPDRGWTPSEILFSDKTNGKFSQNWNKIETKCYPEGIWFIREYTIDKKLEEGGLLKEHAVVTDAWFNRPLPDDAFTLEGIGVRIGSEISDFDTGTGVKYAGENRILDQNEWDKINPIPAQPLVPIPGRVNYWLVAACIVFAIIAALLLTRACRHRAAST